MDRNITWSELTIRDLLRADFFENTIAIYKNRNDTKPLTIDAKDYYDQINGLYVPPQNSSNYNEIKRILETAIESKLIFVEGYAGCGKSTLINKIFYDLCHMNDSEFSYEKYNYMLSRDRYNFNNGANTCLKDSNEINSLIKNQLVDRIVYILESYGIGSFQKIFNVFKTLVDEPPFVSRFDKDREIVHHLVDAPSMAEKIENLVSDANNGYKSLKNTIMYQMVEFNLNLLFATDFAWRFAQYLAIHDKTILYVCYDNLDAIDNLDVLQEFHQSIVVFITRVNKYFKESYREINNRYRITYPQFYMLVTYRKITATRVSHKTNISEVIKEEAGDPSHICQFDISNDYNYSKIVTSKVRYFMRLTKKYGINLKITRDMTLLNKLNSLQIIKQDYQAFWNQNFRGCADVMDNITTKKRASIRSIKKLINQKVDDKNDIAHTDTQLYTGASSIFLRAIYNMFSEGDILNEQCLNLIPIMNKGAYEDQHGKLHYTSLSRLILRFFYERGRCRLDQLFKTFDGIYTPEQIVGALYPLLEKNDIWRRLLYYTDNALPNDNLKELLMKQARMFSSNDYYDYYSELKLCPCGEKFVSTISSSFEFYACRCNLSSKSLFDMNSDTDIKCVIDDVQTSVENCCERLQEFRTSFMKHHNKSDINFFLSQPFNAHTRSGRRQLYEERVIFNHIAYLEAYRCYAIKIRSKITDKISINKILVDAINQYLELYDKYIVKYDPQRQEIAVDLNKQADKIIMSEYQDFETKISR